MRLKFWALCTGFILISGFASAGNLTIMQPESYRPWSVIGSFGYTWYDKVNILLPDVGFLAQSNMNAAPQTVLGRIAIARELWAYKNIKIGAEIGLQSGNTIQLDLAQTERWLGITELSPQLNIKPMVDYLWTAYWYPHETTPIFYLVKLGLTYRHLQVNNPVVFNVTDVVSRTTNLSEVAGEIQAGLGIPITERATISINYQGIFTGKSTYSISFTSLSQNISHIPNQNGIFLSLSYFI